VAHRIFDVENFLLLAGTVWAFSLSPRPKKIGWFQDWSIGRKAAVVGTIQRFQLIAPLYSLPLVFVLLESMHIISVST